MSDQSSSQKQSGRIAAGLLIVFAIIFGYFGATVEYAFSSDPIGPRGFPVGLAVLLVAFGLYYFLNPGESDAWPEQAGRIATLTFLVLAVGCVLGMPYVGFVPAMTLLLVGIARLFGASWMMAVLSGLGQSLLWWFLFGPVLGGNLPKGPLGV